MNTEVEMMSMTADVNDAPKGEYLWGPRGCDHKEEKEPSPMTVEWGGRGLDDNLFLRVRSVNDAKGRDEGRKGRGGGAR